MGTGSRGVKGKGVGSGGGGWVERCGIKGRGKIVRWSDDVRWERDFNFECLN